ncbi:MAG: DUF5722 domain-containing protein [Prosthecobacter sp.]|nr:DUF5722 domain-containing protein [Prosthecobacter sp.]
MIITAQGEGVITLTLEEGHPHFWTSITPPDYQPAKHSVFALEYFAPNGLEAITLRYRTADGGMAVLETLNAPLAEAWQPLAFDLSQAEPPPAGAAHPEMRFHLALQGRPGAQLQMRNLQVREPTPEEQDAIRYREQRQAEREADAEAIEAYFAQSYPASIHTVHIGKEQITVIGKSPEPAKLVAIPPHTPSHRARPDVAAECAIQPDAQGQFRVDLPRRRPLDRECFRWRLASEEQSRWLSHAAWPTAYGPAVGRKLQRLTADHQKGIGMPPYQNADHEIFSLGIRHATVNMVLTSLLSDKPQPGWEPWPFEERAYHFNPTALQHLERTLSILAEKDIIVSAILLVPNHRHPDGSPTHSLIHPEAEARGIYSIPNLAGEGSTHYYRALFHFLAERWSRPPTPEQPHPPRVSNWILHNEVDQAATWTNMGDQPLARYLETYLRSARIVHHSTRLFDPTSRVFVSLTHHWASKSSGSGTYIVREMLELFSMMSRAEGDFEWGVAYHPYPRDLRNPDTWLDAGLTDDFDTPYITPKNIQVLPAFLSQPRFLHEGRPRGILLSEQGFNTPTLSLEDQQRQAAGLLYVFDKIRAFPVIEAFHLHRYHDMPVQEGNLRLGIITETGAHKLGWQVYQDINTEREAQHRPLMEEVIRRTSAPP